ncbi:hypothetical protein BCR34DRAFT_605227 [Clohesyomyces aquaticus]|uniref:5-formyltetrahydrofolate cyclo-ligase n=1 Tax=Clohesyomyces aquaticus TaxID=1231657 RepID=A0A1Y1YZL8_9PLEO|nr:hypothetical protein BCR34DRAFT_605227 [Clohesyomyces aquaticus]
MSSSPPNPREALRRLTRSNLLQHVVPDSRFGYDMSAFIPDFRGSSSAVRRLVELPCYKSASTLLVEPDNCLQELRFQALKDGKKMVVSTYGLRRGFVLLDPRRIGEEKFELASLLDGMEKPGLGRNVSWTQLQEEGIRLDLCVAGAVAVTLAGLRIDKGYGWLDLQWGMFMDRGMLGSATPVAVVVHSSQIVRDKPSMSELHIKPWDTPCNFIVSPDEVIETRKYAMPIDRILWDKVKPEQLATLPPLQELKGIQMMETIMRSSGLPPQPEVPQQKPSDKVPNADELMGIQMVEKIMKGYKP